ncbi:MAG TPA: nuclear transport factor 2 family protein [Acidimicrobiales bacterium]|nr:nuclear transport factor 2 family protein [Acidimicrobiales bacterium]
MSEAVSAWVEAELQIRNLIARIAILADQGDLDEYADQFTEDGVWAFPSAPRHGRADIRAGAEARRLEGTTGPGTATRHLISTVAVRVDQSDRATADSYFVFLQNTTTSPTIFNMGAYHDSFVRDGQIWRLARREITLG